MSYLAFLLLLVVPPIVLVGWLAHRAGRVDRRRAGFLGAVALLALLYTTPWDNYLIWRGVWGYGPDRVLGTIGYVPVEEYLFFLLQPLLTGLWLFRLHPRDGAAAASAAPERARWAGAALYALAALAGAALLRVERGTYLGLILAWAAPVLALQWAYAGPEIWARRGLWLRAVAVPTLYLWAADALAIRLGIWHLSPTLTTGAGALGLPLEEAVFFLITNLLVVQGVLLFLHPPGRVEARRATRAAEYA